MKTVNLSERFIQRVADNPQLQHAAVRVGLWLVAVAERINSDSIELYYTHFLTGYKSSKVNGVSVKGVNFRPQTVANALQALIELGIISIEGGDEMRNGVNIKRITLHL